MIFNKKNLTRRKSRLHEKAPMRLSRLLILFVTAVLILVTGISVIGVSAGYGTYKGVLEISPDIGTIDVSPKGYSTFVYDKTGKTIATLVSTDSNRIPVSQDGIPEMLAHAFVAIEDERFYRHKGIDIPGIFRAVFVGVSGGFHFSEGASTITQQLIKNNVFTDWTNENDQDRLKRKIQEQYLAYELEKTMPKSEILLNYLNTINLGHNTLGVEAASQRYFDKHASDLTLAECAVLAAITQNPSAYDPVVYPENNRERQEVVLEHMLAQNYITREQYEEALSEDVYATIARVNVDKEKVETQVNTYFVDALIRQVLRDLQDGDLVVDKTLNNGEPLTEDQAYSLLYSGGLRIYSTQDPTIQQIVDKQCSENSGNYPPGTTYYLNYALTVTAPDGTQTNYDSNSLEAYFSDRDSKYSILYTSKYLAKKDVEEFRKSVMGPEDTYEENYELAPQPEISVTVEDQETGYVVAMLGGRGEKEASRTLNRATDTTRQPGSTFKIVSTFTAALDSDKAKDKNGNRFTLSSTQVDEKFNYGEKQDGPEVHNWYKGYRGTQTIRAAIQDSLNVVTVKTLTDITPRLGFEYAEKLGINTLVDDEEINGEVFSDAVQTLALGGITYGVRNIELNAAFSTIANGGRYIVPRLYTKVTRVTESKEPGDTGNEIQTEQLLLDNTEPEKERVLKRTTCWLLTDAMKDVLKKGTGTEANFTTTAVAGKTGTTEESNDVWFAGYTPNYTATVWAGYDNNTKLSEEEESLAMIIWRQIMSNIPANKKASDFVKPDGLTTAVVCKDTGLLALPHYCDHTYTEYFVKGTEPKTYCTAGQKKKKKEEEKKKK
ncbi:MAG: transglycosylase domain-containing protein, partial [Eubacteriales bacterium]|nr:transglycosylase domain-containing protein [Eubacteriales bacterium]